MIRTLKPIQKNRPVSRLQINIDVKEINLRFTSISSKIKNQSVLSPLKKPRNLNKSPSKQNERPKVNLVRTKTMKASPVDKIQLPLIKNKRKSLNEQRNCKKQTEDFETFCSKGNAVFVDQRDAGVKLGNLNDRQKNQHQNKSHLGETAYVPFNIEDLRKKVEEKLNMSISTVHDEND